MNAQHTPGPWVAVELPTAIAIKSHMGNVANIQRGSIRDQQKVNARLIAAAPDLLAALKLAEAALSDIGDADREPGDDVAWCDARAAKPLPEIRAAIAKAGGEA